jgi:hypothetical protein
MCRAVKTAGGLWRERTVGPGKSITCDSPFTAFKSAEKWFFTTEIIYVWVYVLSVILHNAVDIDACRSVSGRAPCQMSVFSSILNAFFKRRPLSCLTVFSDCVSVAMIVVDGVTPCIIYSLIKLVESGVASLFQSILNLR